jgi:AmmeMemoRadiSam system protein B
MDCSSMKIRPAAVAGLFYDSDPARLSTQINALLDEVEVGRQKPPRALIVPHAGYIYSGATAAQAYARLRALKGQLRRVALFGPAHRVYLRGMAVPGVEAFRTPLGEVPLDLAAIDELAALPNVSVSDAAHAQEHSLEVQLPFLQCALGSFRLVPVAVGESDPDDVARAMELLWEDESTLMLVSSDLSHFHSYEQAKRLDGLTCERLLARSSDLSGEEACGARALNGLMRTRAGRELGMELLHLCNSGDTAGDKRQVVGYGAFSLQ